MWDGSGFIISYARDDWWLRERKSTYENNIQSPDDLSFDIMVTDMIT